MVPLETTRLCLEPLDRVHADRLYAIYSEPAVRRHLITRPAGRAEFDAVFDRALRFGATHGMWTVIHKETAGVIGRIGFFGFGDPPRPDLAFLLSEAFWRIGLATEASSRCLGYAFRESGWSEVVALVRPANAAAVRVVEKLGMRPERTIEVAGGTAVVYEIRNPREGA
jgi:ribosomal-protein-alanine N-acetyltransferase